MKRSIITVLALITLCGCSNQAAPLTNGLSDGSSSEEIIQPERSDPPDSSSSSSKEIVQPEELRQFVFNSAEDVMALSNDDIIYIAVNDRRYSNSDFFSDISDGVDLFGIPLLEMDINGKSRTERVETYMFQTDIPIEELNVNEPIPDDVFKGYTDEHCAEMISYANFVRDDGTGRTTKDEEIIFCGENDACLEYSIRYTSIDKTRINGEIVTTETPRAYRRCFLKNELMTPAGERTGPVYFGELSLESVKAAGDFMLSLSGGSGYVYREVSETDDAFIYSLYGVTTETGEPGECFRACLARHDHIYDKETHVLSDKGVILKETEIPGTKWYPEIW